MIGSFRLPTHRRNAHRNFFLMIPFGNRIEILVKGTGHLCPPGR